MSESGVKVTVYMHEGAFGKEDDYLISSIMSAIAEYCGDPSEWSEKYGTTYENEVFEMHRYCWCEKDDCKFCGETQYPNFIYKPTQFMVWWYKYIGRGMEFKGEADIMECAVILHECLKSIDKDRASERTR